MILFFNKINNFLPILHISSNSTNTIQPINQNTIKQSTIFVNHWDINAINTNEQSTTIQQHSIPF
jgi:hypothetical protein